MVRAPGGPLRRTVFEDIGALGTVLFLRVGMSRCMARAFVSDAKYIILDEPTAALDPIAESHMYENFARIFEESGTIMISHRLASVKMADRIMVLDGGRIVQMGSHEELMAKTGLYQTMFTAQSSWYEEDRTDEGE